MDLALDIFYSLFHLVVVIFNLTGWLFESTRKAHLVVLSLTLFSWVGLGYFYGWGYCFLTDWHYQVLQRSGHEDLPPSYITFMIERVFGVRLNDGLVDTFVAGIFIFLVLITYGRAILLRTRT